jgi:mono/diheme cytochrome c family protein
MKIEGRLGRSGGRRSLPRRGTARGTRGFAFGVLAFLTLGLPLSAQPAVRSGAEFYQAACSACHGAGGTGVPRSQVGFDIPLPDFTDCGFASREPDDDWLAVAHGGGAARGFDEMMPAFGDALTILEFERILAHIRGFCRDDAWPRGELNLPRAFFTEKAYPEDEAVYTIAVGTGKRKAFSNEILYEKRFGPRNQIEIAVPFGWREGPDWITNPESGAGWVGSLGDLAVGVKRAVFHSLRSGSIFSFGAEVVLPTGDRAKGLGRGTSVFEPFASYGQIMPADFFFQSQAGLEFPFDADRARKEGFWRLALGRTWTSGRFGRAWSPMIELLGAREMVSGGPVRWDVVPQMQITLNRRQHVMMNVGVRVPTSDRDNRDTVILFYLLWDWFDGGFLEGW